MSNEQQLRQDAETDAAGRLVRLTLVLVIETAIIVVLTAAIALLTLMAISR